MRQAVASRVGGCYGSDRGYGSYLPTSRITGSLFHFVHYSRCCSRYGWYGGSDGGVAARSFGV